FAVASGAWWATMEALASGVRGFSFPLLLVLVCGTAALVLVNAHSQRLGQYAGAISLALFVAAGVALWGREASISRGAILVIMIILLGLFVSGRFYADLTMRDMLFLAAAPLAAWAGELPGLGKQRSAMRVIVRTLAVLVIV